MFENPRRGRQTRNFGKNVPKILHLKSSSEQIFSENCRWVPLYTPSSMTITNLLQTCCNKKHVTLPRKMLKTQCDTKTVVVLLTVTTTTK